MPSMADRLRAKLEDIEARVGRTSAKFQTKVRTQRVAVINLQGEVQHMKSSWIRNFTYDNTNHTLYMTVHSGKTYSWENVPADIAWNCIRGNATCTTDDKAKRWWIGKNPSLGASYWTYLKNFNLAATMSPPISSPYTDITTEFKPSYNVSDLNKGKGRPSKIDRNAAQFAWSGRYQKKVPTK